MQAPGENALLGVQAVLRLVEHHRLRPVDDLVGHLLAPVGGQAVHEQRVGLGAGHQPVIDLVGLQQVVPARAVAVAHRHPGVGDDAVGAFHGLVRIGADADRAPSTP